MRRIITLTLLSLLLGAATAATDAVEQKAARHYRAGEWANAAAMYGLLIDRHPQRTDCYARAITSAAMRDSLRPVAVTEQMMLLHRALRAGVPVDSLIISVGRESIALGHAGIYERFLKAAAESEPWMSRIVDAALLRYYTARRDPQAIERYARAMLAGQPGAPAWLFALADGQLGQGDIGAAARTWLEIAADSAAVRRYGAPTLQWRSMVDAGLALRALGRPDSAATLLRRAYDSRPTPYLKRLLSERPEGTE